MNKLFLYDLLNSNSVSGNELEIEKKVYNHMLPLADAVSVDEMGTVTASINPESSFRVLMTGHADEIGMMVTAVTSDGFLKVTNIGGIRAVTYPGHKVRVHTKNGPIYGAVVFTQELAAKEGLKASDLTIDIGALDKEDALKIVALGDTVNFDTDIRELLNDRISARAMDDRVGVYIVMEALRLAKERGAKVGVYAAATTGEETTGNGAYFTASRVRPNIAIAVDVTYTNDYAGINSALTGDISVGKGPVICNNPSIHKLVNARLYAAAEKLGMSVQTEAANGRTGTDGDIMHKTCLGVPFALVSIPLRYMHTPGEVGSLKDIQECAELLAQFLCDLDENVSLKPF